MQPAITLASGSTTDPFFVQPDGWVIIEAGSASATLQYTTGTPADISNGTATWVTAGTYTGFTAIRADEELADTWVKLTAASGSITYHVEGELSKTDRLTIRGYKKTSINSVAPSYALDSSGNATGLEGPGGGVIPITGYQNSVILIGDSMLDRTFVSSTAATSISNNGDGTATAVFASGPLTSGLPIAVGDFIKVVDNPTPLLNQRNALVTAINTTSHTITYRLDSGYSSLVGGTNGYIQIRRKHQPLSLFSYLNMLLGGELVISSDCSQGGCRLEHATELMNQVGTYSKFGIFLCGRNDIYASGNSYAQVIAAAETALTKARSLCETLIVVTTPPQDSTQLGATWTTAKMQIQLQYEAWTKQRARKMGAIIIDSRTVAVGATTYGDATSANANPVTAWTPDGTHQGTIASYALGKAIAAKIASKITPSLMWPTSSASVYANDTTMLTDNALLTGTAGTVTPVGGSIIGTAPDGVTITVDSGAAALTVSQVARSVSVDGDAAGNWLRIVATNASGTSSFTVKIPITAARFVNGDTIRAQARVNVSASGTPGSGNPVNLTQLDLTCRVLTGTSLYGESNCNAGTSQAHPEGFSAVMITPPMTIRSSLAIDGAPSSGYVMLTVLFTGAGGATIDVSHMHIRKEIIAIQSVSA